MQAKASNPITSFLKAWFGDFQREELKKFLKLGGIFALVIGVYWTLRPLKDSIFSSIVGVTYQPMAKLVSLIVLFPLVIIYSKLVDKFSREKLFYVIGTPIIIGVIIFGLLFYHPTIGLANTTVDTIAYCWLAMVCVCRKLWFNRCCIVLGIRCRYGKPKFGKKRVPACCDVWPIWCNSRA